MEEDNQKSPSCPDFVIPPKDQPFDVYKTNSKKDKLFSFPNKSWSSTAKHWAEGLKKGSLKKDFGFEVSAIKTIFRQGSWLHEDVFHYCYDHFLDLVVGSVSKYQSFLTTQFLITLGRVLSKKRMFKNVLNIYIDVWTSWLSLFW